MKKVLSLLALFFVCISCFAQWTSVAPLPENVKRHHPITFAIGGYGYSIGGAGESDEQPNNLVFRYDPIEDTWTELGEFPGEDRGFAYGVANDTYAFMGFGGTGDFLSYTNFNDLWRFEPVTETWTKLTPCPCQGRLHPAFVLVDDKIFVGLGNYDIGLGGFENLKDWWEYDIPTDTWTQKEDFIGTQRHHPYYFDLNGYAYVGFGHGADIYNDFYRYDPRTETWQQMNDFPGEGRVAGTQFSHEGYGYILSGDGEDHGFMETGEFWQYDPDTDSWIELESHPGNSRWAPGSFVIDDKVYFVQGQFNNFDDLIFITYNDMMMFDLGQLATSIDETMGANRMPFYPNPVQNEIMVELEDSMKGVELEIKVVSLVGEVLKTFSEKAGRMDVSDLKPGYYILSIKSKHS